ncbi:hypothetical protein HDV00_001420 [Rhizophlyctis rosea]|nr:hypothetical protein HDV00_001420 [Rhizophlyctis rosea]
MLPTAQQQIGSPEMPKLMTWSEAKRAAFIVGLSQRVSPLLNRGKPRARAQRYKTEILGRRKDVELESNVKAKFLSADGKYPLGFVLEDLRIVAVMTISSTHPRRQYPSLPQMLVSRAISLLLLASASVAHAAYVPVSAEVKLTSTGTTVSLGGIDYFIPPASVSKIASPFKATGVSGDLIPLTVISTTESTFTASSLEKVVKKYAAADDVFNSGFLGAIYIKYDGNAKKPSIASISSLGKKYNTKLIFTSSSYKSNTAKLTKDLPTGPYFLDVKSGEIYQAYRLYSDEQQAFVYGTIPTPTKGSFSILNAHIDGAHTATVGVPSRLYYTKTKNQPLAGYRLAVKDIYDVKGLKTGCGNRAYYQLYDPKSKTAPAVQKLIDAGAIVIGKTKTSQFANGESPTSDWVDLHSPFNPRGEGYQNPSSSSSGSGASMAAYDWLDIAIGSDTGGSMRGPAGSNGLFGNRPSHGAVDLSNVMPLASALDTAGVFARDAEVWKTVGHAWYTGFKNYNKYPKKVITAPEYYSAGAAAQPIFEDFADKLTTFLGGERLNTSINALWASTKPASAPASFSELLSATYPTIIAIDQIRQLADPFYADYAAKHDGRQPFINPVPLSRWAYGRQQLALNPNAYDVAIQNKTIYMDWWNSNVSKYDSKTCSDSLFLYPQSAAGTSYRNRYGTLPGAPTGFSTGRISVFTEIPDYVIPLTQLPYNSTISGATEYLPVTVSLMAAKGCDLMLFNLIADLQKAGIIKPVKTGSQMY